MPMTHQMQVIATMIDYLVAHHKAQPDLVHLAAKAGYDPAHFQKLFKTHVGLSPKRLVQYMNVNTAKALMATGEADSLAAVADKTGLSGTGRLHDLFVTCEAITPGQARYKGAGVSVSYGFAPTPLGEMLVAKTGRGICYLGFVMEEDRAVPVARMKRHLPEAVFVKDDAAIAPEAQQIMSLWQGREEKAGAPAPLSLELHGTNMQIQVWQALLKIPAGQFETYGDIARQIGRDKAARAVGNAVGANPVSLLIPCHRVIRSTGIIDNYGWGNARKKLLLGLEAVS